jgi:hypothetical protein
MTFRAKVQKAGYGAKKDCVRITTGSEFLYGAKAKDPWGYFGGRKVSFLICPVANGIQIARGGRRGGARSDMKSRGGILLCTSQGQNSKCLRAKDFVAFPGGGAKVRAWNRRSGGASQVLNGYSKTHRKHRRSRRGAKRRG